jgi:hypothetical protein
MVVQDRQTGIDSLKLLPWGSHICVFYSSPNDLGDIFVPYFKAGLENNEFCVWITPNSPGKKSEKAAINRVTPSFASEGLIKEYETDFLNLKLTSTSEAKHRMSRGKLSIAI